MAMDTWLIVIFLIIMAALLAGNVFVLLRLYRGHHKEESDQGDDRSMALLLQQMNDLAQTVDNKLGETNKQVGEAMRDQFRESQRLVENINERVNKQLQQVSQSQTEMKEKSNQIFSIAEQLQDLQRTLKSQKERGNFGEASLELILSNILPPDVYQTQYRFSDGMAVDAVIHARDGMIPVDAKFSLENYNLMTGEQDEERRERYEKQFKEDLKKRIDETAKYIKPREGTLPFAFMFIPAEGIYYDLLINRVGSGNVNARNLIDYAMNDKKVIIVSPTTFYAYLQSVLYGFNAFKIEKNAEQIQKNVGDLSRHLKRYDELFQKVGNSLKTTVNHYNSAGRELLKVDKDVVRITGESAGLESVQLERPEERE